MLNREKIIDAFQRALDEDGRGESGDAVVRPRTVALRAHAHYCATLDAHEKRPAADTFRKFAVGATALPEIVALLSGAGVRPIPLARIDRERLRSVFAEAIRRLETRLVQGRARPLQVVRRAYELYTREGAESALKPSHRTFENLIYGKAADPEIVSLIETALKAKGDA